MFDLQKPIPSYLNEKQNILRLILFTSLFALVFINIYSPFGADRWFNVTRLEFFTYSSLIILTGVLVVVVSRVIMFRVAARHALSSASRSMIPFYDEKGILKFSVKKENLLYLESAENYVSICYMNKDKISKYLLRDTLKKIEETFTGTEIIRCHRSYMVNFEKVKIIRRDSDGLKLGFDNPLVADIPVSKTYINPVMETFSKYSQSVGLT